MFHREVSHFLFKHHPVFLAGYFKTWQLQLQEVREENTRAENVARILQKNRLGRVLQAWRVVNQEECIIEPLVKRRVRRNTARCGLSVECRLHRMWPPNLPSIYNPQ
jgi:hypothetical protein